LHSPDPEIRLRDNQSLYTTHSHDQLSLIRDLRLKGSISLSSAFYLAAQMVHHGFPEAHSLIKELQEKSRNPAVLEWLSHLELRFSAIAGLKQKRAIFQDEPLMRSLYLTEGATFVPHPTDRRDLMVVFLTAFNNFGMSNSVLLAVLQQCGFSALLLRDCSKYRYLKGVEGCGGSLHELANHIENVRRKGGFDRLFVTGFSSGGYASLFMTTLVNAYAYIGFSIESDFSAGGPPATRTRKVIDLRGEVDARYLLSLRGLVAGTIIPGGRFFFAGEKSRADRLQSECFESLPGCSVEVVPDCVHEVTSHLLEHDRLIRLFQEIRQR
jgi:hypothetical protein